MGIPFDEIPKGEQPQAIWLTSPNNDQASMIILGTEKFCITSSMDSEVVTQAELKFESVVDDSIFCAIKQEIDVGIVGQGVVYDLHFALVGYQLLFRRTFECRHLQMQVCLGASWDTGISPIPWWKWSAAGILYVKRQSGTHQQYLKIFSFFFTWHLQCQLERWPSMVSLPVALWIQVQVIYGPSWFTIFLGSNENHVCGHANQYWRYDIPFHIFPKGLPYWFFEVKRHRNWVMSGFRDCSLFKMDVSGGAKHIW